MPVSGLLLVLLCVAVGAYVFTRRRQSPAPASAASSSSNSGGRRESLPAAKVDDPKQAALFMAAASGNEEKVRALLQEAVDPVFRNEEWVSPLGSAIANGEGAIVRALLDAGVDPNAPAVQDQPALFVAVSWLRASLIPDLVRAGAALDFAHPQGGSTLALAIAKRDPGTIEALFKAGVPIGLKAQGAARRSGSAPGARPDSWCCSGETCSSVAWPACRRSGR